MPLKKKDSYEPMPVADNSTQPTIYQSEIGHYICLSHPPSESSLECASCHNCNSNNCTSLKLLEESVRPTKVTEVHVSKIQLGKCDKCGSHPNVHAGIQTSEPSNAFEEPCKKCTSTGFSADKIKNNPETPSSQRSFRIPPTSPVKPHSCEASRSEPTSQSELKISSQAQSESHQDGFCPKEQLEHGNQSTTNVPSSPPTQTCCQMPGCRGNCIPEDQNVASSNVPGYSSSAHETSKIHSMPAYVPNLPRRQGSNIASKTNQIMSASLLRKSSNQKDNIKKRSKDSKTSIKSNASSKCKCQNKPMAESGCPCHYPPAFQHYFQCTGTITGVCCCSQNK